MRFLPAATVLAAMSFLASATSLAGDAAPQTRHALVASAGLRGDLVREDLLVPLAFAGPGLEIGFGYVGWVGPGVLAARGDFGLATIFNRFGHPAVTMTYGAEATWTLTVFRALDWHLAVGPALALDSRMSLLLSWDDTHGYWLGSEWLGPAARIVARVSDTWRLEGSAAMALLGFLGRPPSYRYDKQEISPHLGYFFTRAQRSESFVMLDDLQVLRLDAALRRAPYDRFDVGRGWAFGLAYRLARAGVPKTNINMSLCFYAKRAWGL